MGSKPNNHDASLPNNKTKSKLKQERKIPEQERSGPVTAHDWKNEKTIALDAKINPVEIEFFDDGTVTFFWWVYFC